MRMIYQCIGGNSYDWCDMENTNEISSWDSCIRVMKKSSDNNDTTSLCISHTYCNEKLPYICESTSLVLNIM